MKLNLDRKWFEDRISAEDNCEVGACVPSEESVAQPSPRVVQHAETPSLVTTKHPAAQRHNPRK